MTHRPRRPHAHRGRRCAAVVLVFDTGSAESFAKLQRYWLAQVQRQRLYLIRQPPGSTVVLAHVVDEVWPLPPMHTSRVAHPSPLAALSRAQRREREVTRRDASSWCAANALPYFETHAKDSSGWRHMLAHLAHACLETPIAREQARACWGGHADRRLRQAGWVCTPSKRKAARSLTRVSRAGARARRIGQGIRPRPGGQRGASRASRAKGLG